MAKVTVEALNFVNIPLFMLSFSIVEPNSNMSDNIPKLAKVFP